MKKSKMVINSVLDYLKMNPNSFSRSIGLKKPDSIYHIINERNNISDGLARRITDYYPEISYDYLMKNIEPMIIPSFMDRNDRLAVIIERSGLSHHNFIDRIGYKNMDTFKRVINREISPPKDLLDKTLLEFPNISPIWLLSGQGNMLKKDVYDNVDNNKVNDPEEIYKKLINLQEEKIKDLEARIKELELKNKKQ